MKKLLLIPTCIFALCLNVAHAQTDKEQARAKMKEAIRLEDSEGKYDEALVLLKEAQKLDPENYTYPFEQGYTYTQKKEYQKAVDVLEPLLKHKDVDGQTYQALANNYDYLGQRPKALKIYEQGLQAFPNNGGLYTELGNTAWDEKDANKALAYYEQGIKMAPTYASNYYKAARIFCLGTTEKMWGMIYGEIFMNLERNSARTKEISKMLFDTYKSQITFTADGKVGVSFSKNIVVAPDDIASGKMMFSMIYESSIGVGAASEKFIDIAALNRVRTGALGYYEMMNKKSPNKNLMFDYQTKVKDAGHLEAYSYWILMQGDSANFNTWKAANNEKWDGFLTWFADNGLKITDENKFTRLK